MKKSIPLTILERLQPFADKYSELIEVVPTKEIIFKIVDKDKNSDFYFQINKQEFSQGAAGYSIEFKPANNNNISVHKGWSKLDNIVGYAENWKNIIVTYNNIQTIYDDPILKQYEEEFYNDFKIVDEDASINRFNFSQQIIIVDYIENVTQYLASEENDLSGEDKTSLIEEIVLIKQDISVDTKDTFVKKLSGFWAKIRKKSIKACEFVIKEFAKEVIKEIAKKGVTINWASLPEYIEEAKSLLK